MPISLAESLHVVYREAIRSPWVCLSALRGCDDEHGSESPVSTAQPVLVLGGFLSHPYYYAPLGRILTRRGYAVHFDDVFNARPLKEHVARLRQRVDTIVQASGSPLRIVGHSLGGIHAMILLLEEPDAVGQVIAVASPVAGGTPWRPLQRLVERVLRVRARDTQTLRRRITRHSERITTISSPHDLIAPPDSCSVEGAANVVLAGLPQAERSLVSHTGVIFMRAAVRTILGALEQPLASAAMALAAV